MKSGEKGIRILAPIIGVKRKGEEEAEKDITKQNTRVLVGFRNAYVFDVSQTEGVELPAMHEVYGDVGENRDRLVSFMEKQGIALTYTEKIAPALGMSYGGASPSCPSGRRRRSSPRFMSWRMRCCTGPNAAPPQPRW